MCVCVCVCVCVNFFSFYENFDFLALGTRSLTLHGPKSFGGTLKKALNVSESSEI